MGNSSLLPPSFPSDVFSRGSRGKCMSRLKKTKVGRFCGHHAEAPNALVGLTAFHGCSITLSFEERFCTS